MSASRRHTQFDFGNLAKRPPRPQPPSINTSGLRSLTLVEAARARIRPHEFTTEHKSPWTIYKKEFEPRVGKESFIVATRKISGVTKDPLANMVLIKTFSKPNKLRPLPHIKHANIVSTLETFENEDCIDVVFEYMAIPLSNITGSLSLDNSRLIAIIKQVLCGVIYLESKGWEHTSLNCFNVLIHDYGNVKIFGIENCEEQSRERSSKRHAESIGVIVMSLMQGYSKPGGVIGLENPDRWSPDAVSFLSHTISASTADLAEHSWLQVSWQKEVLIPLVALACRSTRFTFE